jgi:hypothetical protein
VTTGSKSEKLDVETTLGKLREVTNNDVHVDWRWIRRLLTLEVYQQYARAVAQHIRPVPVSPS